MSLINFSVVLVGENFPVQTIKTTDFTYRHRPLKETLRLPVALQAENPLVSLQVLTDRFEVRVKAPDDLDVQCEGLLSMVSTFLEYVGRRTVTAVGHNAQWSISGTTESKSALVARFTNSADIVSVLGTTPQSVDLSFNFRRGSETQARLALTTGAEGDALLDFNFHFDISTHTEIDSAMGHFRDSLGFAQSIGEAMDNINATVSK